MLSGKVKNYAKKKEVKSIPENEKVRMMMHMDDAAGSDYNDADARRWC